jgi:Family of unknown function (DUF6174)
MYDLEPDAPRTPEPDSRPVHSKANRRRLAPLMLGVGAGCFLAFVVLLAILFWTRERTPRLTEEYLNAAMSRWDQHGPSSYDLELALTGNRPGKIQIEVRHGEVTRMIRDGVQPSQKRTWDYWSVPGQFDTIDQELEMARDPAASFKSPTATQMIQWAVFDPKYGYPAKYDRVVLGTDFEIHWKVTRFEPR